MGHWRICRGGRFGWQLETVGLGMGRFPAPSLYFFSGQLWRTWELNLRPHKPSRRVKGSGTEVELLETTGFEPAVVLCQPSRIQSCFVTNSRIRVCEIRLSRVAVVNTFPFKRNSNWRISSLLCRNPRPSMQAITS